MSAPGDRDERASEPSTAAPVEDDAARRDRIAEKVARLPTEPGCYLMHDRRGTIFYIGKASNLRSRVRSYFSGSDTRQFVAWLDDLLWDLDFVLVNNEKEALLLERTLVRQHQPRFNVLLRDDKNFIHLRLAKPEPGDDKPRRRYPRLEVVRNPKEDGARYFGPYHSASSVRASLRVVNRHFQLRTCSDAVLENRARPCLQYQIGRCPAPCIYEIDDYGARADEAALFLAGRSDLLLDRLEKRMWEAAEGERFEAAAQLRDQVDAVQTSLGQQVVTEVGRRRHQDVVGVSRSGALLEITRVAVRGGKMVRTDNYSFEKQEFPTAELVMSFLGQLYGDLGLDDLPDEILTDTDFGHDAVALGLVLSERRGKRVVVKTPARGQLKRLVGIATMNAEAQMAERLRQTETREKGLERLQQRLRLSTLPRVMECFDISIFQGAEPVASKVCFVDGVPDKSRYRRYNIKTVEGTDDFGMMYEAILRRLKQGLAKGDLPDLLFVDGGKGQLGSAIAACKDLGIKTGPGGLELASIAKARTLRAGDTRLVEDGEAVPLEEDQALPDPEVLKTSERVFLPNIKAPILLRPHTQERYLVERLRDEAHRFAIEAHRKRRKKRTLRSRLDEIPGVGPSKRRALLRAFGGLGAIQEASVDELRTVQGIGPALAQTIKDALRDPGSAS